MSRAGFVFPGAPRRRRGPRPAFPDCPVSRGFVFPGQRSRAVPDGSEPWVRFSREGGPWREDPVGSFFRARLGGAVCRPSAIFGFVFPTGRASDPRSTGERTFASRRAKGVDSAAVMAQTRGAESMGARLARSSLMTRVTPGANGCAEFRTVSRSRREVIRVGALAGLGLALPDLLRARDRARAEGPGPRPADRTFGRARSVIMIYLHGGPAQQETWDPK